MLCEETLWRRYEIVITNCSRSSDRRDLSSNCGPFNSKCFGFLPHVNLPPKYSIKASYVTCPSGLAAEIVYRLSSKASNTLSCGLFCKYIPHSNKRDWQSPLFVSRMPHTHCTSSYIPAYQL